MSGNVGYLEIRSFNFDAADIDSTLTAAMNFLAHTDALIVDVRRNGGGEPAMVAAVCSYLMPANTLINKFYWRPQRRWDEFRTGPVRGQHYGLTRPLYVLTSDQTFSGAEEFAYDVQTQKRGEVVGDTTGWRGSPGRAPARHRSFRGLDSIGTSRESRHRHQLGGNWRSPGHPGAGRGSTSDRASPRAGAPHAERIG